MRASRIELYLRPSGQELERVEAYEDVTLLEQRRRTTGTRLTYYGTDNRYVVVGNPVKIVDDCNRETTGRTLTFYQDTDRVVVDGNEQIRTRTTGASTCP
jgi:lipopolysaccharide export system protein LptA